MLYIMRHGKTEWNKDKRLQGRTDIPLSEEGRKMAESAASEYKDVNFDICYCSPLIRAKETAEILLKGREIPVITDDRLMEMCFGAYEGSINYWDDVESPINVLFKNPEKYEKPVEGAESLEDLFHRTGEFLKEVIYPLLSQGKDVLIMGHGAMNSSIICQIKEIPVSEFWSAGIENCKLMELS